MAASSAIQVGRAGSRWSTLLDHTRWWSSSRSNANVGPNSSGAASVISWGARSNDAANSITSRSRAWCARRSVVSAWCGSTSVAASTTSRSASVHGGGTSPPGSMIRCRPSALGPAPAGATPRGTSAVDGRATGRAAGRDAGLDVRAGGSAGSNRGAGSSVNAGSGGVSSSATGTSGCPPSCQH